MGNLTSQEISPEELELFSMEVDEVIDDHFYSTENRNLMFLYQMFARDAYLKSKCLWQSKLIAK